MNKNNRITWICVTAVYMLGILYASTIPGSDPKAGAYSPSMEAFKNFLHFPAYGTLGYLLMRSFSSNRGPVLISAFLIATGWGVLNEVVQSFIPHRYWSLEDMCVNALGAGIVIAWMGRRVRV